MFDKACELHPKNSNIYRVLGNIQFKIGETEGTIESYQKAIELNQQQPFGIYKKLGDLLCQQDRIEAALLAYQEAFKLQPQNLVVRKALENIESGETIS